MMWMIFEFSNLKNEYTRKSYSLIDLIGEVGGVFEVFLICSFVDVIMSLLAK